MTTTPEGWEKKEVDAFLKLLGSERCFSFKPSMSGFGNSGIPDYCICLLGAFWALEIKRPGKEPTALQARRIEAIRSAGGHAAAGTADVVIAAIREWLGVRGVVV